MVALLRFQVLGFCEMRTDPLIFRRPSAKNPKKSPVARLVDDELWQALMSKVRRKGGGSDWAESCRRLLDDPCSLESNSCPPEYSEIENNALSSTRCWSRIRRDGRLHDYGKGLIHIQPTAR